MSVTVNGLLTVPRIATVGVFDGVHQGHRFLLEQLHALAAERGAESVVIAFGMHPATALGRPAPPLLTLRDEKVALLERMRSEEGLFDRLVVVDDVARVVAMSAHDFMADELQRRMGVSTLLMGFDHRFGREQRSDTAFYRTLGDTLGMEVLRAQQTPPIDGLQPSSTNIRGLLEAGQVATAAQLLGRCHGWNGVVIHGDQRGRAIGFPTANMRVDDHQSLPADGVYAATARTESGRTYAAMLYIGRRPTFEGVERRVEAHLIGFDGDLYGQQLAVEAHRFLRGEQRFDSLEALKAQLVMDEKRIVEELTK